MTTPPDPPIVAPTAGRWYRIWRVARYLIGLAAAGAALWAVTGKTDELQGATGYLAHMRWWWVVVALGAEVVSYLAYSALQRALLSAGKVHIPIAPMMGISVAGTAIQNSLPGGLVFYAAYAFRQYKRFGADDVLAGWTLVAVSALSVIALSCLAAVGFAMAFSAGTAYDLGESILAIVILGVLIVVAWTERGRLLPHASRIIKLSQRFLRWPDRQTAPDEIVCRWMDRIGSVSPSRVVWSRATTMAFGNWVGDMACLAFSFLAVGAGVPWRGLLLAYGAGQLASILPITPGGLGVVEGSITVALVTFGGGETSTVAAVLLYRLISFWLVLPVGWGSWIAMLLLGRNRQPAARRMVEEPAPT